MTSKPDIPPPIDLPRVRISCTPTFASSGSQVQIRLILIDTDFSANLDSEIEMVDTKGQRLRLLRAGSLNNCTTTFQIPSDLEHGHYYIRILCHQWILDSVLLEIGSSAFASRMSSFSKALDFRVRANEEIERGNFRSAVEANKNASNFYKECFAIEAAAQSWKDIGNLLLSENQPDLALQSGNEAKKLFDKIGNSMGSASAEKLVSRAKELRRQLHPKLDLDPAVKRLVNQSSTRSTGDFGLAHRETNHATIPYTVSSAVKSHAEAVKVSREIDYLGLFIIFFVILGGYHVHAMLTMGDWDFWSDWKDRRLWVTVTPIMLITFPAAVQAVVWEHFRIPFGATMCIISLLLGEWINRYFNFWGWTYYPINIVFPSILTPGAILLDGVLLLTNSYLATAIFGGTAFGLIFYPSNWVIISGLHMPVDYYGILMTLADISGYHYIRTGTPEYIRMIEKGTLRTFGKDVAPVSAFFSAFVCILIYFIWHFFGRWFGTTDFLART